MKYLDLNKMKDKVPKFLMGTIQLALTFSGTSGTGTSVS